jgi:hypothetical protein
MYGIQFVDYCKIAVYFLICDNVCFLFGAHNGIRNWMNQFVVESSNCTLSVGGLMPVSGGGYDEA